MIILVNAVCEDEMYISLDTTRSLLLHDDIYQAVVMCFDNNIVPNCSLYNGILILRVL